MNPNYLVWQAEHWHRHRATGRRLEAMDGQGMAGRAAPVEVAGWPRRLVRVAGAMACRRLATMAGKPAGASPYQSAARLSVEVPDL